MLSQIELNATSAVLLVARNLFKNLQSDVVLIRINGGKEQGGEKVA